MTKIGVSFSKSIRILIVKAPKRLETFRIATATEVVTEVVTEAATEVAREAAAAIAAVVRPSQHRRW